MFILVVAIYFSEPAVCGINPFKMLRHDAHLNRSSNVGSAPLVGKGWLWECMYPVYIYCGIAKIAILAPTRKQSASL